MGDTGKTALDEMADSLKAIEMSDVEIRMTDRAAPAWAGVLSTIFTVTSGVCLLSAAVMAVFFQSLVAERGELILAPLLVAVGAVPVLGSLILDYAHARALAGYRKIRRELALRVRAGLAVVVFLSLMVVHPLLGIGLPVMAVIVAGGLRLLSTALRKEPLWDFKPSEAVSVLSGRDHAGQAIAGAVPVDHALAGSVHGAAVWMSVLASLAAASWLVAEGVLAPAALAAVGLITLWAADGGARYLRLRFQTDPYPAARAASVRAVRLSAVGEEEGETTAGLRIRGLSAHDSDGRAVLSDISFDVPPGSVTGIIGDSGAGKSLLLRTISDPFAPEGLEVRGNVRANDVDLWQRRAHHQPVPAVLLPATPLMLPASGRDNLAAFQDSFAVERGKNILEQLVFSSDLVGQICACPRATRLPGMQQKTLAFARAFLIGPSVYLMDRPEDGLPDKQVSALIARMNHETRLGRGVLMATENRALLERCDRLIILQEGRIIDYGEAGETRARLAAGWMRFVGPRRLDTEDNLERWVRSHFKRNGDEANRRKVCLIASEMLAFSCQGVSDVNRENVSFEFKHFEGYCILKLLDSDVPVSSAQLQKARDRIRTAGEDARLPPLSAILRHSLEVESGATLDRRELTVRIETYDPRKAGTRERAGNAAQHF